MIGRLPVTLTVAGEEHPVRTDFRDILRIMEAFNDPELDEGEKYTVMLTILYPDFLKLPPDSLSEAIGKALWFLDCGQTEEERKAPCRTMDWGQDEAILFPAINKVAGCEVRSVEHMHWWTFVGHFMEIGEGTFSMVLGIRQKKSKGKKLEKWEQEFYRNNRALCDLKTKYTQEEQEEIEYWNKLLN